MSTCPPGNFPARLCALERELFPPVPAARMCFITFGDVGDPGSNQDAIVDILTDTEPDAVLDAGDNNYLGGDPDAWDVFQPWITAKTYLRVRGNHSLDTSTEIAADQAAFGYLFTDGNPWWVRSFGNGLIDFFGIDTGKKTNGTFIPGGNQLAGGTQYLWLKDKLEKSKARHKIVMFHHPIVSTGSSPTHDVTPEMDWDILWRADAIFCGHVHMAEWLLWKGLPVISFAGAVRTDGSSQSRTVPPGAVPLFINDIDRLIGRLWVTPGDVLIEAINTETGRIEMARSIYDKTPRAVRIQRWLFKPDEFVVTSGTVEMKIGRVASAMRVHSVLISTGDSTGTSVTGKTVRVEASSGQVVMPAVPLVTGRVSGEDLDNVWIPPNAMLRAFVNGWPDYSGSPAKGLMVEIVGDTYS